LTVPSNDAAGRHQQMIIVAGLVWGLAAIWHNALRSLFIKWTEWALAMAWQWWQHHERRHWCYLL